MIGDEVFAALQSYQGQLFGHLEQVVVNQEAELWRKVEEVGLLSMVSLPYWPWKCLRR